MVEYVVSRAAGWDCPFSLNPRLQALDANARTPDNLEVMQRWHEVVKRRWLTHAQKEMLRIVTREHALLVNEAGDLELVPCEQILERERPVCAFIFERKGRVWVVYWHSSGRGARELDLRAERLRLWEQPGRKTLPLEQGRAGVLLPAEGRRYLECADVSKREVVQAFQQARLIAG